jgi:hypothetical protein
VKQTTGVLIMIMENGNVICFLLKGDVEKVAAAAFSC